jgi:hypothetical protein
MIGTLLVLTSNFLTITSALAATSPAPSSIGGSATPAGPGAGDGGLVQYWWLILIVLIATAALWYFLRRNERTT